MKSENSIQAKFRKLWIYYIIQSIQSRFGQAKDDNGYSASKSPLSYARFHHGVPILQEPGYMEQRL